MIKPATYNIVSYQGATYDLTLTYKIDGSAVDLTGYTAAMQVRSNATSTATILDLSSGSGITLGGTAGTIAVLVSAETMGAATPGTYVYDFELDSGSQITRLLQGSFTIQSEVTR